MHLDYFDYEISLKYYTLFFIGSAPALKVTRNFKVFRTQSC